MPWEELEYEVYKYIVGGFDPFLFQNLKSHLST